MTSWQGKGLWKLVLPGAREELGSISYSCSVTTGPLPIVSILDIFGIGTCHYPPQTARPKWGRCRTYPTCSGFTSTQHFQEFPNIFMIFPTFPGFTKHVQDLPNISGFSKHVHDFPNIFRFPNDFHIYQIFSDFPNIFRIFQIFSDFPDTFRFYRALWGTIGSL